MSSPGNVVDRINEAEEMTTMDRDDRKQQEREGERDGQREDGPDE